MASPAGSRTPARAWFAATALVSLVSMVIQLVLVVRGVDVLVDEDGNAASTPTRVLRFFSYFTIQSNVLAMLGCTSLAIDPGRDGRGWRVLRISGLVGMTVTFVVYVVALRPIVDLHGAAYWTDIGFHYVAPVMVVVGWLLWGPWPRLDRRSALVHLVWPVGYLLYVLAYGAGSGWYPYPFLDVDQHGYPRVLLNGVLVAALLGLTAAAYVWADARTAARRSTSGRSDASI